MLDWSKIDTCVLDMDGTLLDLNFDHHVWNVALPAHVAEKAGMSHSDAERYVRDTLDTQRGSLNWYCFDHWSAVFGVDLCEVEASMQSLIQRRPGCDDFLGYLRTSGHRIILATNAHPASLQRKLSVTAVDDYFDHIVSSHEYGACKESNTFWTRLFSTFDLDPTKILFLDDNEEVLHAAESSGVCYRYGICYPSSTGPRKTYTAHESLERLTDLIPIDTST